MNVALRRRMTVDEFLAWEEAQEDRWEFDVLSTSTASTDIVVKNREYAATLSIQRYIMLLQDSIGATVFERRGDNWVGSLVTDPDAPLDMPEIGVSLPLKDCYEGVIEPA